MSTDDGIRTTGAADAKIDQMPLVDTITSNESIRDRVGDPDDRQDTASDDIYRPDWRSPAGYRALDGADPSAFAWEWLRRTGDYRRAWHRAFNDRPFAIGGARAFGLECFEDPFRAVPTARPIWSGNLLPDALTASLDDIRAPRNERIDLRVLAPLVTIAIDDREIEHLLISDGRHFLRIDIVSGTLIGCPASLTYLLRGLTTLGGPLLTLRRLSWLVRDGKFEERRLRNSELFQRWILELRVADALAAGCDQQRIARALYGGLVSEVRWRADSAPYRRRVQRLVAAARSRLSSGPARWFRQPSAGAPQRSDWHRRPHAGR